ncbi:hypothetical protein CYLTODRAFT_398117 [Cylindrobasidium torrendii FP15055 ss-10]|uniref:Uncharacterized protein n=1 Tax=Cylindrobasidium torrendii FP15055 ss-10 TaxID=1314674 RepID=A0A0D7B8P6_9AGAR|nr:hypothetical protein CYLTODRAFT_398117 [Cylindrobasidium torrendii FP15055 ss-10]
MEDDSSRHHSLAHELAFALMPEPSAGSKLLAEEFGIEYDEGAEGIDGDNVHPADATTESSTSLASELDSDGTQQDEEEQEEDPQFGSPVLESPSKHDKKDAMETLAENLESTDKFLSHLRNIDVDTASSSHQPALEKLASDVIRRLNDTARDRESQVRELLEYEREFRKISVEVGGTDVLGQLEEITGIEELSDQPPIDSSAPPPRRMASLDEEPLHHEEDWDPDLDPDHHHHMLGDEVEDEFGPTPISPRDVIPPPPTITGPPTPAVALPQLADLRSFTRSLVSSLTLISEQTQINGAATTEAGRKIRALKNKVGGWRTDWDGAERSRVKIEKWELEGGVNGRKVVQEHLSAFEIALTDAATKTQAIMAPS